MSGSGSSASDRLSGSWQRIRYSGGSSTNARVGEALDDGRVLRALRRHPDDHSLEELDVLVLVEHGGLDHAVVLLNVESPHVASQELVVRRRRRHEEIIRPPTAPGGPIRAPRALGQGRYESVTGMVHGTSRRQSTSIGRRLSTTTADSTEGKVPMRSKLRTASWVLLTIAGGLTLLFSLVSTYWAYWRQLPDRRRAGRAGGGGAGGHPHRATRDSRDVGGLRRRLRGAVPGHGARSLPPRRHGRVVDDPARRRSR